ncbi:hypothetical protein [Myroides guanonis]|uniref:Uncharacterized protein n=1 Tax=Myroides guanonis TaxID=1150112 RepID=A0A1I3PID9_9FLAO|nr:hypothetical protein [Myroides guanonis]SFJ21434.1 hypothetical protein SAMN04487893_104151 [Myroides guanonis]
MRKESNISQHSKKEVFKIPDGYFEDFNDRLFSKLENKPNKNIQPKLRKIAYTRWISIAASVTILLGITIFYTTKDQYSNLNTETIESYLQSQNVFISTSMESYLEEQDLTEIEQNNSLNNAEIGEYLLTSTDIEYYITE